jgi:hypothetical protein
MIVMDFDGETNVRSQKELERRLRSIRKGNYGAFVLMHKKHGPSLSIHVSKELAWLHYFPDPNYLKHAGYHTIETPPPGCKRDVRFRVLSSWAEESGGDYLTMPPGKLVSLAVALAVAKEFFKSSSRPTSVGWQEL